MSAWEPEVYNAVSALLDQNVERGRGEKTAFADPERSLTYSNLQAETCRMANFLQRAGVRREERIGMIMLDTIDFPVVFLGAMRAGVVPVPLNTLLLPEQYAYMLADSRARLLFISDALLPVYEAIAGDRIDPQSVVVCGREIAPYKSLARCLSAEQPLFETAPTHPDEPAFWLYSSGSTGAPKGVRHVHSNLMATAETYAHKVLGIREDDVCHSAAKLFFAYGLGNGLTFPMSVGATTILNPERPTPASVFRILKRFEPTIFYGVPTLFAAMLHDPATQSESGSPRLRICTSAGEALPEHVGLAWKERFGVDILDGVGSTEMLHIYLSNAPGDIKYGTSGFPVPGYEVRLVDENGASVTDGEIGEMLVAGPSVAEGYWNKREKSRSTFEGRWLRTGDKYYRDAEGRYVYCGRADDMFKVSGVWVSPFEVESALIGHPDVLEAAVIPAPDEDGLLKPKAFIVLKNASAGGSLTENLKEHVKSSVGVWKYPRWIEVVDALPKTATGKIQRFKLRDMESARH
jgi:4-hydroxybenzoate-CoA ligase